MKQGGLFGGFVWALPGVSRGCLSFYEACRILSLHLPTGVSDLVLRCALLLCHMPRWVTTVARGRRCRLMGFEVVGERRSSKGLRRC